MSVLEDDTPRPAILTLSAITKRFDANVALNNVSFQLRRGTVHALLGENGAGKTTLMRIAFGLIAPDAGEALAGVPPRRVQTPLDAIGARVGMVHQHFTNVAAMTVAENVALGSVGSFRASTAERRVAEIGARTGLVLDAHARAENLTVGAQQRLEIVKALARDATVLILDEPTAVLAPDEADDLLRWLRDFADAGNAVVLITHKLREALSIADEITVLRRGTVVLRAPANEVSLGALSQALVGGDVPVADIAHREHPLGAVIARVDRAWLTGPRGLAAVRDASFDIRAGEILGFAGVEGAGQRELLRALAGRYPVGQGTIEIPDVVGFVPEDRHRDGLVLDFTITDNLALARVGRRRGRIAWRAERERARVLIAQHDVRGGDDRTPARALSGGNQQKLILARELDSRPALLVVENPSRGLDIRATRAVHDRLRSVAANGAAVVVYSSDLDEVLSLATRILAIHAGVVRECPRDRAAVGRAMLGVA